MCEYVLLWFCWKTFSSLEVKLFNFYFYHSLVWCFHCNPNFLDILFQGYLRINIFFYWCTNLFNCLPEILSSIPSVLVIHASVVLILFSRVSVSSFSSVYIFLLLLFPLSGLEQFYLFPWLIVISSISLRDFFCFLFIFGSLYFFKEFIHLLLKRIYHLYKIGFQGIVVWLC